MKIPTSPRTLSLDPIARPGSALFASVRTSRDWALAAFAGAILGGFVLHAGAFVPRLDASRTASRAPAIERVPEAPAAPVMARRPPARAVPAALSEPCTAPRG